MFICIFVIIILVTSIWPILWAQEEDVRLFWAVALVCLFSTVCFQMFWFRCWLDGHTLVRFPNPLYEVSSQLQNLTRHIQEAAILGISGLQPPPPSRQHRFLVEKCARGIHIKTFSHRFKRKIATRKILRPKDEVLVCICRGLFLDCCEDKRVEEIYFLFWRFLCSDLTVCVTVNDSTVLCITMSQARQMLCAV